MKHSGLAAELHVVHWSVLVDTEGKEGESRERPGTRAQGSISHWGAEPSPAPAPRGCRDIGTHPLAPPLFHLWPRCASAAGRGAKARPEAPTQLSIQLTNPSHIGTVARSQTAPHTHVHIAPCPLPPPNSKEQNKPHISGLFMFNIGKTLTNVTNAK